MRQAFLWEPVEKLFKELVPLPSFIVSDTCLPYTIHIANKFSIPGIFLPDLRTNDVREIIKDESEDFFVLGTLDKIEVTKRLALSPNNEKWNKFSEEKRTNYSIVTQQGKFLDQAY
ncbi:hypothetical protein Ahy_A08g039990 [Arachis hypogaea]|uniref:Uncharacterized protein n=1 Tax=Arachis hypogaea TaxID=3818 RepID=A0A445BXX6_ARAHY|nr:hypothetical protein Ahy_A08g039990 [Arachis hypogaea]